MALNFPCAIASAYYKEFSPEDMVTLFLRGGFCHTELAYEHAEKLLHRVREKGSSAEREGILFRQFCSDRGFSVLQGHLSFKPGLFSTGFLDLLKEEIELYQGMGVDHLILHLEGGEDREQQERENVILNSLSELLDFCRGSKTFLCIENLSRPISFTTSVQDIIRYLDQFGRDHLGICLDTGHLHLANARGLVSQSQREFILAAGKDLRALHIANNDGCRDQHLLPFNASHSIHWDVVMHALEEIGYQGLFNLEIGGETSSVSCPFAVKQMKISYIRDLLQYMLSDDFLFWQGNVKNAVLI